MELDLKNKKKSLLNREMKEIKMPQNEFKPFAVASNAAVLEQEEYETSQALREGFKKGLARSVEVNKAIRQASSIAAAVAEFAAEKSGKDMLDNGEVGILKENFEMALNAVSSLLIAEAQGTGDMLTASFSPELRELKNGTLVHVRAKDRNRTKTPVFKADETGEKVIVKGNNLNLEEGDIAGTGHWLELQYDEVLDKWVLHNPAKGITPSSGVPVGTIEYFAMATPPPGYLKADGAPVGKETYPELFAAIGTTFGVGDGETTFNLPDLIDRFAQGSNKPGEKVEAGLPNITGTSYFGCFTADSSQQSAAFVKGKSNGGNIASGSSLPLSNADFDASCSNPTYGASDTVQPPALTLLPCIKAFDAATNPGLIDITELANDVTGLFTNKLDKTVSGTAVKYVTETYNVGTNWYRKWSDGWMEQGGINTPVAAGAVVSFMIPFSARPSLSTRATKTLTVPSLEANDTGLTRTGFIPWVWGSNGARVNVEISWYACGYGAQS